MLIQGTLISKKCIQGLFGMALCIASPVVSQNTVIQPKARLVAETGLFFQPNKIMSGTHILNRSGTFFWAPALWGLSAKIEKDVSIKTSSGTITIPAFTILPAVKISGVSGLNSEIEAFCTYSNKSRKSWGHLGDITQKIMDSAIDGQKCLYDENADGIADFAFLLNEGNKSDRTPQRIDAVGLNTQALRMAGPGFNIQIYFENKKERLIFYLNIEQDGVQKAFDTLTVGKEKYDKIIKMPKSFTVPYAMNIFGVRFLVTAFDPISGKIEIKFPDNQSDGVMEIPMVTNMTKRYW